MIQKIKHWVCPHCEITWDRDTLEMYWYPGAFIGTDLCDNCLRVEKIPRLKFRTQFFDNQGNLVADFKHFEAYYQYWYNNLYYGSEITPPLKNP